MSDNVQSSKDVNQLHRQLVQTLREQGKLRSPHIEMAFKTVKRHQFLPHLPPEQVYQDKAIALKKGTDGFWVSSSSQPTMMALMLDQMRLHEGHNVLEIGTASGYNAALMNNIVGEIGHVTTIELDKDLADQAADNFQNAHLSRIMLVHGDGAQGYAPRASYDRIIATAGLYDIPMTWKGQLKQNGFIVAPVWIDGVQVSAKFTLEADGSLLSVDNRPCSFVYLRGKFAPPTLQKLVASSSLMLLSDRISEIDTASLHQVLSDSYEITNLQSRLNSSDYWYGFQIYLMMHAQAKKEEIFVAYTVHAGQKAYGLENSGIGLIGANSVAFSPYYERGVIHSYSGSDMALAMQSYFDAWDAQGRPTVDRLRLRFIPRKADSALPEVETGHVYRRRDHDLHVWLETE